MTKIVGLTGGIGSGKTTVAKMFEKLGVPIYIADLEAKKVTNLPSTLKIIEEKFGNSVITGNELNRAKMAEIVFNNPEKLKKLNQIIHPLVAEDFEKWMQKNKSAVFVIKEAAILLETENDHNCDFIITVTAPIDIRIDRVKGRDGVSENEILKRINNQWTDEQRINKSDFVIENINLQETLKQVSQIHKQIIKTLQ